MAIHIAEENQKAPLVYNDIIDKLSTIASSKGNHNR